MKIAGQELVGVLEDVLVLPRPGGKDIVFKARAVMDMTDFNKLCPTPKPPMAYQRINGQLQKMPNMNDTVFKAQLMEWSAKRAAWLTLKALEPTQIEWETIDLQDASTWMNYEKELRQHFADMEVFRIIGLAAGVNGMNEQMMEEARERFLLEEKSQQEESSSPPADQETTPNGEPANDSESNHPVTRKSTVGTK